MSADIPIAIHEGKGVAGVGGVGIITAKSAHGTNVPTDIGLCGWAWMTQRGGSGSMSCTARVKAWVESLTRLRNEGRRHTVVTSSEGKRRRFKAGV